MRTDLKRTVLNVTTYCNLKCKHCLAFIPYMKNPKHLTFEMAKKCLAEYFKIVDTVEHFTLTGGEPLLNKDISKILKETLQYSQQVKDSIDFVTNATMEIPADILHIFAENKEKPE